jgi:hypothetical protein
VKLEGRDAPAGTDDARELAQRCPGVVHVPEEVCEGEPVEARRRERECLSLRGEERDAIGQAGGRHAPPAGSEHLRALIDADNGAAVAADELNGHGTGTAGNVDDRVAGGRLEPRDEEGAPASVLTEGEEARVAVVTLGDRCEELAGRAIVLRECHCHEAIVAP